MIVGFVVGGREGLSHLFGCSYLVWLLYSAFAEGKLHLERLRFGKFDTYNTFRLESVDVYVRAIPS